MVMGYFYWDPDRAMLPFNLPFLDRPILWYGFLFAFGFFIAYWILVYLLHRYFLYHSEVFVADIVHWPDLVHQLKNRERGKEMFRQLFAHCSKDTQQQIKEYQTANPMTKGLKEGIVRGMNALLREGERQELQTPSSELLWGKKHLSLSHQVRSTAPPSGTGH